MLKQNFSFLRMVKRIIDYLNQNEEHWQDNNILKSILYKIIAIYNEIEKYRLQQQTKNIGYASQKKMQKNIVVVNVNIIMSAIKAYAYAISDNILLEKLTYTRSELLKMKDFDLETLSKDIIEISTTLIDDLLGYGVNQEIINTLTLELTKYNELTSEPAIAIKR